MIVFVIIPVLFISCLSFSFLFPFLLFCKFCLGFFIFILEEPFYCNHSIEPCMNVNKSMWEMSNWAKCFSSKKTVPSNAATLTLMSWIVEGCLLLRVTQQLFCQLGILWLISTQGRHKLPLQFITNYHYNSSPVWPNLLGLKTPYACMITQVIWFFFPK